MSEIYDRKRVILWELISVSIETIDVERLGLERMFYRFLPFCNQALNRLRVG